MPIDPTISLGIALPKAEDPVKQYEQGVQMRQLLNQQRQQQLLQPLQLQEAQISLKNAQLQQDVLTKNAAAAKRQQQDADAVNKAYQDDSSFDTDESGVPTFNPEKFETTARKLGASPQAVLEYRKQRSQAMEAMAKETTENIAAENAKQEQLRNAFSRITDDASRQAMVQRMQDLGYMTAAEAKEALAEPYTPENQQKRIKQHSTAAEILAAAKQAQEDAEKALQLRKAKAEAIKAEQDIGITSPELEGKPQKKLEDWYSDVDALAPPTGDTAAANARTKANLAHVFSLPGSHKKEAEEAYDKLRNELAALEQARMSKEAALDLTQGVGATEAVEGSTVEDRLKSVPAKDRPMVGALIRYDRQPVGGFATKDPDWKRWLNYAYQVDVPGIPIKPGSGIISSGYDDKNYAAAKSMYVNYTSGNGAKQINGMNTVIGHLARLSDAVDALNNGNVTVFNRIANYYGLHFTGNPDIGKFKTIVNRVGPEITTTYVGSSGEASERYANKEDFDVNLAPQVLKANTAESINLLRSKMGALENQWNNMLGLHGTFKERFIPLANQQAMDRIEAGGLGHTPYSGPTTPVNYKGQRFLFKGTPEEAKTKGYQLWQEGGR